MKIIYDANKLNKNINKYDKIQKASDTLAKGCISTFVITAVLLVLNLIKMPDKFLSPLPILTTIMLSIFIVTYLSSSALNLKGRNFTYQYKTSIENKETLETEIIQTGYYKSLKLILKDENNFVETDLIPLYKFAFKTKTDIKETEIDLDNKTVCLPYKSGEI